MDAQFVRLVHRAHPSARVESPSHPCDGHRRSSCRDARTALCEGPHHGFVRLTDVRGVARRRLSERRSHLAERGARRGLLRNSVARLYQCARVVALGSSSAPDGGCFSGRAQRGGCSNERDALRSRRVADLRSRVGPEGFGEEEESKGPRASLSFTQNSPAISNGDEEPSSSTRHPLSAPRVPRARRHLMTRSLFFRRERSSVAESCPWSWRQPFVGGGSDVKL